MKSILTVLVILFAAWVGGAFVYERWNTYTHRFRLLIETDTPAGIRSGSGVIQVSISEKATWLPQTRGISPVVTGEAVAIDFGNHQLLYAILRVGPVGSNWPVYSLAARAFGRDYAFWYREAPNWRGSAKLHGALFPGLVTFTDANDPRSARLVTVDQIRSARLFGITDVRISIEMTKEPVTDVLSSLLPWVRGAKGYLSGSLTCDPVLESCLSVDDFRIPNR